MTPAPQSALGQARGDVLAPTASSLRKRALDGAASAAGTAPGEADAPDAVAAQPVVALAQPDSSNGDVMAHGDRIAP